MCFGFVYCRTLCSGFLQQDNQRLWHGCDAGKVVSVKRGRDARLKGPIVSGFCSTSRWTDWQREVAVLSQLWIFRMSVSAICQLVLVQKVFLGDGGRELL